MCSPNEDFDFQEYFQVSADQELKSMPIWNIFWDVVNSFDPKKKRYARSLPVNTFQESVLTAARRVYLSAESYSSSSQVSTSCPHQALR